MAWDAVAQNLAVNVIAKVESAGAYDAINPRDPITVGLMQWFGSRAANLLNLIRETNPSSWPSSGALSGLTSDLNSHVDSNGNATSWWVGRWLNGDEIVALKPVLRANHEAQHQTISQDIDDYRAAAERIGMNPDTNTQAVIFFCVMYHQTPARAISIVNAAGVSSSIDRLYAVCMNDSTFNNYRTRYTQARDMIKSGDAGDLIDIGDTGAPGGDGDPDIDDALNRLKGSIKYLSTVGDTVHIELRDGNTIISVPDGRGRFLLPAYQEGRGETVPGSGEDIPLDPNAPGPDAPSSIKRQALIDWGMARLGKYSYTNGPARTDPERTLATDCSGFVKACYGAVTGIKLAQITSGQYTQGRRLYHDNWNMDFATLRPGDLIYFKWKNPAWQSPKATDHVEMYKGNGDSIGHPGPGKGPRVLGLAPQLANALHFWVQRHIED